MDVLAQLNRAMAYLEAHMEDDGAAADVSSVTTYSPYHFGRLFYYVAGMPLSEYIRKRRLSLAAMRLQSGNERVLDLALLYGYDSADSFTRAFVRQHGCTPSEARKPGAQLTLFPSLVFQIQIKGVEAMHWRMEERDAFEVFGIERRIGCEDNGAVPAFWTECHRDGSYERIFEAANAKPSAGEPCTVRAVCGYEASDGRTFPYMLCALKNEKSRTEGITVLQIPKATWAVFRSDVSEQIGTAIPVLFSRAYSEWLPSSGYDRAPGPDMELYYSTPDGRYFEEVWIPVRKA